MRISCRQHEFTLKPGVNPLHVFYLAKRRLDLKTRIYLWKKVNNPNGRNELKKIYSGQSLMQRSVELFEIITLHPMSSANVRSLLRNERKARRIEHPHATYNSSGVLSCQLCHISIKAESLWSSHIHGSHHRGQLQRLKAAQASQAVAAANAAKSPTQQGVSAEGPNRKKRKADDDEDIDAKEDEEAGRKKTRAVDVTAESVDADTNDRKRKASEPPDSNTVAVDEAEWAAFTREMASSPPTTDIRSTLEAAATISAAPVSAAELAARSREGESRQAREARETEAEGEREDAAQRIEEELDEQEQLQERVKKLKEKREALRQAEAENSALQVHVQPVEEAMAVEEDNEDESEEEDELLMWPR